MQAKSYFQPWSRYYLASFEYTTESVQALIEVICQFAVTISTFQGSQKSNVRNSAPFESLVSNTGRRLAVIISIFLLYFFYDDNSFDFRTIFFVADLGLSVEDLNIDLNDIHAV